MQQSRKTTVIIAHRLHTIRDADIIFVMKHGEVVEQGHHDQLMALHGLYENMVQRQEWVIAPSVIFTQNFELDTTIWCFRSSSLYFFPSYSSFALKRNKKKGRKTFKPRFRAIRTFSVKHCICVTYLVMTCIGRFCSMMFETSILQSNSLSRPNNANAF